MNFIDQKPTHYLQFWFKWSEKKQNWRNWKKWFGMNEWMNEWMMNDDLA